MLSPHFYYGILNLYSKKVNFDPVVWSVSKCLLSGVNTPGSVSCVYLQEKKRNGIHLINMETLFEINFTCNVLYYTHTITVHNYYDYFV